MREVWLLLKVQLLGMFGLNKARYSKDAKQKNRFTLFLILGAVLGLFILGIFFLYDYLIAESLRQVGALYLLLSVMMAVASIITLITTIYKADGVLFRFRDYDLLASLPVKASSIITSRILLLYSMNLLFTLMVMLPAGVVYAVMASPGALYYLLFLPALLFIPLVPILLASAIGALLTMLASRFRHKNVVSIILIMLFCILIMFFSFSMGASADQFEQISVTLSSQVNRLYPLAALFSSAVCGGNIGSFLLFVGFSAVLFFLFCFILAKRYNAIHSALMAGKAGGHYELTALKTSSPFKALYKKELRRYFSSPLYVVNTSFGMVLLLVFSIALLFVDPAKAGEVLELPGLDKILNAAAPPMVSLFVALSCTSACSVSLEGRHLWITKSTPVRAALVFYSKAAVNLTILLPPVAISCLLLLTRLRAGILSGLLLFLMPVCYAFFTSFAGLLINLKFHRFDWKNEAEVVKQGMAPLLSLLLGMALSALPMVILFAAPGVSTDLILGIFSLLTAGASFVMARYLARNGEGILTAL